MNKLAVIVFALVLGGCSKQEYTTDYLFKNDEVRQKVLDECKANKQSIANCQNANEAEARKFNSSENKKRSKTKVLFGNEKDK